MTSPSNILSTSLVLDRQARARNHLAGIGANDMYAKHTVGLLLGNKLDKALGVEVGLRARVGREGVLADLVLHARGRELLLGLADPRDLRVRVHDRRDRVVVDVPVPRLDVLDRRDALLLGLVREHGPEGHVADALDPRHRGVELVVDDDAPLCVDFGADGFQVQAVGVWPSTDGDKNNVGFELEGVELGSEEKGSRLRLLTVSSLPPLAASTLVMTVSPFRSIEVTLVLSLNLNPCFCRIFWKFFLHRKSGLRTPAIRDWDLRNLLINSNTTNSTQELNDRRHIGP